MTLRILDPRVVELRFRYYACGVSAVLVGALVTATCIRVSLIVFGDARFESEVSLDWGSLPDISLCPSRGGQWGYDVRFAYFDIWAPAREDLHNNSAATINATVTASDKMGSCCLTFSTSTKSPVPNHHFAIDFWVSFESRMNPTRSIFDERSKILKLVAQGEGQTHNIGYLQPYPINETQRTAIVFALRKQIEIKANGEQEHFYSATEWPYTVEQPHVPVSKIRDSGCNQSSTLDPHTSVLNAVSFSIKVRKVDREVPISRYVSKAQQFGYLIGSLGGWLTAAGCVFAGCFPRKYLRSNVAATYDIRTLRGNRSSDANVFINADAHSIRKTWVSSPRSTLSVDRRATHSTESTEQLSWAESPRRTTVHALEVPKRGKSVNKQAAEIEIPPSS